MWLEVVLNFQPFLFEYTNGSISRSISICGRFVGWRQSAEGAKYDSQGQAPSGARRVAPGPTP